MVVGGLAVVNPFTAHASRIDVAEAHDLIPGDLVYDTWHNGDFQLAHGDERNGFDPITYLRAN